MTSAEDSILSLIETHFGPQNRAAHVDITGDDEAVIWVRDRAGNIPIVANLTNLAAWLADGTIADQAELKRDWLHIDDT